MHRDFRCAHLPLSGKTVFLDLLPLTSQSAFQGIGRYVVGLAYGLEKLSARESLPVRIVAVRTAGDCWDVVPLQKVAEMRPRLASDTLGQKACNWRRRVRSRKLLRQLRCDLFHLPEAGCVPLWPGVPLVLTIHDIIPIQFPHLYATKTPRLRLWLNTMLLKVRVSCASHIVTDSEHVKNQLQQRFQVPPAKISVAYNGVDLENYHANAAPGEQERIVTAYGLKGPYFLYVGTADPRKNLPFLFEAMAVSGLDMPLVIAGHIHELHRSQLEAKLGKLHLGERVRFLGYVSEDLLPALYRHSLALLFPSLSEGFGLPVVEAMACGTPVVAFANSSIPEVSGDAAWLVPTNDLTAFVEAMRVLATNPQKRKELVAKGLARARLFTWENTARAVLAVYRQVLGLP